MEGAVEAQQGQGVRVRVLLLQLALLRSMRIQMDCSYHMQGGCERVLQQDVIPCKTRAVVLHLWGLAAAGSSRSQALYSRD